ncbi:MAG TPA: sulfatase-like hydrolase/transferase [Rhizomicrobium sp.]|nr:sulfatase-like hydrolase/transferase [Rhizomicrobium sp.]
MVSRPNVLIFMPDQLRVDALGCYGGFAKTPNIDALAARGTRLTQAYAQNSVCSPSRVSIFTGWYPHVRGHRTLTHLLQPDEPNLLKMFRDAGYHVAWAGRRGDTYSKEAEKASTDRYGYTVKPQSFFDFAPADQESPHARAYLHGLRNRSGVVVDFDEALVQTAEQWLGEGLPEPWVLFAALIFPHPPFEVEEPWYGLHDRAAMPLPVPPDLSRKPAYMRRVRDAHRLERMTPDDWRELRAVYAGMTSRTDAQLGRLLQAVERAGCANRTLNLFFTDHGEYLGDFGLVEKWPSGLDDCLLRNPLIMTGPGIRAGAVSDALVEMVDLVPTLSEMCDLTLAHTQFGKSLTGLLRDPNTAHKDAAFSEGGFTAAEEHLLECGGFPYDLKGAIQHEAPIYVGKASAIRTADWTYIHRLYEGPELYDRHNDPGELRNLAGQAALALVERDLNNRLMTWMQETADVIPWAGDKRF